MKIVILSYNHPDLTSRAVQSVLRFYKSADVILVHNGSFKKHIQQLSELYPEIEHQILAQNKGYSGGANFGLRQAFLSSDWVLFITNDCELVNPPLIPEHPCLLAPKITIRKTYKVDSIGGCLDLKNIKLEHFRNETEFYNLKKNCMNYIPGSAFLAHKNLFRASLGFDESFGTYWEDVDWSIRLQKLGFELQVDTKFLLSHGIGKTCRKDSYYTIHLFHRNRKKLALKHPDLISTNKFFWLKEKSKAASKLILQKRFSDLYWLFDQASPKN